MLRQFLALICLLGFVAVASPAWADVPTIDHPVVDEAGVLSDSEINRIASKLFAHHEDTGVQMAVLFVDTIGERSIERYSMEVAQNWEGGSAERDDGILLTFAIEDRLNRLELGYGIEEWIPDSTAQRMLDGEVEQLRAEEYGRAAESIVDQVIARTEYLEAGEAIPDRFLLGYGFWVVTLLIWFALIWTTIWQVRRQAIYVTSSQRQRTLAGDSPYKSDQEHRPPKALHIAEHLLWWLSPPMIIIYLFFHVDPPGTWTVLEIFPVWLWMVSIWLFSAVAAAYLVARWSWEAVVLAFAVIHLIIGFIPFLMWAQVSPSGSVVTAILLGGFGGFFGLIMIPLFGPIYLEAAGALPEGAHQETFLARTSSGSNVGGSGGGGYSGGGGSFGGGGASGSW